MKDQFLKTYPLYLLLLPVFFVFHGYVENYNLIHASEAAILLLTYVAGTVLTLAVCLMVYRNLLKAAAASLILLFFYFFFGAIYDLIWSSAPRSFFSKYSVLLVSMAILSAGAMLSLFFTKQNLQRLTRFLTILFVALLLVDGGLLLFKAGNSKSFVQFDLSRSIKVCDTCARPDIFFIVTDGYPGDRQLHDILNYDNTRFREQLKLRGFFCPATMSNYNYTPFSIASMFGLSYLQKIKGIDTDPRDLSICFAMMRNAAFFQVLKAHGYLLRNFSLFDIYDQPSPYSESLLPSRTKFISAQTMFNRVEKNLLYNNTSLFRSLWRKRLYLAYNNNAAAYQATLKVARERSALPRFIYTHLEMPHYPYYFDSLGRKAPEEALVDGRERDTANFKSYLAYTNTKVLALVDSITANAVRPPIIFLIADHGYRELPFQIPKWYEFNNSVAILLPSRAYSGFYENISNVNICRTFLNTQFQQRFPLLPDSSVNIVIK